MLPRGTGRVLNNEEVTVAIAVPGSVPSSVLYASPEELGTHLQQAVNTAPATQAIEGATALLRAAAGFTVDPNPVPVDIRTWTLELAAMTYENPAGRDSEEVGDVVSSWSIRRRREILDEAARRYNPTAGPMFSFPAAPAWPA